MPDTKTPVQLSIFPTRETVEQVEQEGLAQLPITNANQLITLFKLHENTILKIFNRESNQ